MSIEIQDLVWRSGGKTIVDHVSLRIEPGETLGLLGPNGSGKSSLLRLISGLRKASSGGILLGATDIRKLSRRQIACRLAFVEQQVETEELLTVEEVVRLGRTPYLKPLAPWSETDQQALEAAFAATDIGNFRQRLWHTLSGGERQRAQIARALAQTPQELLLDEPTNHLDIQHQLEILALINGLPTTNIVALHDLNLAARYCDRLAVMQAGRIVAQGKPEEVLTTTLLEEVFQVDAHVTASRFYSGLHIEYLGCVNGNT